MLAKIDHLDQPHIKKRFYQSLKFVEGHVIWDGKFNAYGNSVFFYRRNGCIAARIAYEYYLTGVYPEPGRRSSKCDYKNCINPEHMGSKWANQTCIPVERYRSEDELVLEEMMAANREFMQLFNQIKREDKFYGVENKTPEPTPGFRAARALNRRPRPVGKGFEPRTITLEGNKFADYSVSKCGVTVDNIYIGY